MATTYYYIYEITNRINGKRYRGQHKTTNLNDNYMGSGIAINAAYDKYGIDNFDKDIIMFCNDADDLNYWERLLVDEYWIARDDTYNLTLGGNGRSGFTTSDETKAKISQTRRDRIEAGEITFESRNHSEETKKKLSVAAKDRLKDKTNHPMYGKKHSDDSRHLMSINHRGGMKKGAKFTDDHRKNIKSSAQNRKNKFSKEELIEKYAANKGKHWWTNDEKNVLSFDCPDGFYKGKV